mmetsp:Transcript_43145/g.94026  ORF Transcript_43145/g.94026 Transcript_43145/m.94026 type:complete len:332 (-) Transcript_43145:2402-3397(-)
MRNDAVALHLPESESALFGTTLRRLPDQGCHRASRSRLHLVTDHVLEPLVVHRSHEDFVCQPPSRVPVEDAFIAKPLETHVVKPPADILHRDSSEGSRISLAADQSTHLAGELFDQVPNSHSGRNGMGVHDDVRRHSVDGEGHVLLPVHDAQRPFLPVPRGKLVTHLRNLQSPHANLCEFEAMLVGAHHDLVDHAVLRCPHGNGVVLSVMFGNHIAKRIWRKRGRPANEDIVTKHADPWLCEAIGVKLRVVAALQTQRAAILRSLEDVNLPAPLVLLLCSVASVGHGSHEAPVHRRLAQHETIFLIVACVAHDEDHGVHPCRHLPKSQVVH